MNLREKFIQHLKQFPFIQKNQKQLLAVSGGVDSIVLCDLMDVAGYDFVVAHCNFQLRGAESDRDEQFVRSLGEKYGKEVLVKTFDTEKYAADQKVSIQVAARELRYDWFSSIVGGQGAAVNGEWAMGEGEYSMRNEEDVTRNQQPSIANKEDAPNNEQLTISKGKKIINNRSAAPNSEEDVPHSPFAIHHSPLHSQSATTNSQFTKPVIHHILTAHHANDNIETVLMNFFKGTGIAGLHGILPVQGKLIRPLLFAKKEELLAYANDNNLTFVEDSSNSSDKYTRNFFRHHLFPLLQEIYPNAEDNLLDNIKRFTEVEELYKQSVDLHKKKLLEVKGNEVHIPVLKLQKSSPVSTIVYEIIKDFGFSANRVQEVVDLLASETGKYVASSSHRVIKNRNWLIISPNQAAEASNILIEENDKKTVFVNGELNFELIENTAGFQIPSANNVAALDYAEVTFPLLLRKWKQGDYFYPLGMRKKKKLSRFFIDQKLSKTDKENVWVLEIDKKIVWILGYRIDDRFKIKPSTSKVLKIAYKK
jgi:tRNA(Ile)-lysidine synthase